MPYRKATTATISKAMEDTRGGKGDLKVGTTPACTHYYAPYFESLVPFYPSLSPPSGNDWLKEHEESGQGLLNFNRMCLKAVPHGAFNTILLVPIGESTFLDPRIIQYVEAFFMLKAQVTAPVSLSKASSVHKVTMATRQSEYGTQLLCGDCFDLIQKIRLSDRENARKVVATVGVTTEYDLTPGEGWNFVFGQARMDESCGVFSLVRYGNPSSNMNDYLRRCCKVLTHEIGHIFGLKHCIYYHCLMNGSNHLEELDRNGMLLCPVCTKKLMDSFQWDARVRLHCLLNALSTFDGGCFAAEMAFLHSVDLPMLDAHEAKFGPPARGTVGRKYLLNC